VRSFERLKDRLEEFRRTA